MDIDLAFKQDYYDRLDRHDWNYQYSESPRTNREGEAERRQLRHLADTDPELREMFERMKAYYMSPAETRPEKPRRPE